MTFLREGTQSRTSCGLCAQRRDLDLTDVPRQASNGVKSGARHEMETYKGHVRTPNDAIILFEACRVGLLPRVQRRLSEKERQSIRSGSVFVWDEREAGMRRWTDGKSWSASRVSGSFLTYREMEGKRGGGSLDKGANRDGIGGGEADQDSGPDGYRYKPDGLMKQSFSITTSSGQHLHLISYFSRSQASNDLPQPSNDAQLRHIRPERGMYPESTVHEQSSIPAVTRGPMTGSPNYTHPSHQPTAYARAPYGYGQQSFYPPSPMHTPPLGSQYSPYYQSNPHTPYSGHSPLSNMHYPPPPGYAQQAQMTPLDRAPPPLSNNSLPPPPPQGYGPTPMQAPPNGYHNGYAYPTSYSYAYQHPPLQAPSYPMPYQQSQYQSEQQQQQQQQPPPEDPNTAPKAESRQQEFHPTLRSQDSTTSTNADQQAGVGAATATSSASSGQTIPSISAMLNVGQNGQAPQRNTSRSPGGSVPRPLQDIPSHKLGFEATRDVQALRNLDKSTFKY